MSPVAPVSGAIRAALLRDPRSYRGLARAVGCHTSTLTRFADGADTTAHILDGLARELGLEVVQVKKKEQQ